jgi:hypothetical protein
VLVLEDDGNGRRGIAVWSEADGVATLEIRGLDLALARSTKHVPSFRRTWTSSQGPTGPATYSCVAGRLVRVTPEAVEIADGNSYRIAAKLSKSRWQRWAMPFDRSSKLACELDLDSEDKLEVGAFRCDASPLWTTRLEGWLSALPIERRRVAAAVPWSDIDGDEVEDLCVLRSAHGVHRTGGPATLSVLSGADGRLLRAAELAPPSTSYWARIVSLGDANGDGVRELALGAHEADLAFLDGATLAETRRHLKPGSGYFGEMLENAGDVDGDGVDDLLAAHLTLGGTRLRFFSGATGDALFERDVPCGIVLSGGDLDGDGGHELLLMRRPSIDGETWWTDLASPPSILTVWSGTHVMSGGPIE